MDIAYISALSALGGSVIGGLISGASSWLSVRSQARAGQLSVELVRRQDLFKDFMVAASKSYGNALINNDPKIDELVELYASISRMRVLCSARVVECADRVMHLIVETYFGPNKTMAELHELMKNGAGIDPLREFSDAARQELHAITVV